MKKQIIALTLSLLVSPLVLAEMDHSKHQGMKMDEGMNMPMPAMDCSDPMHAQMAACKAEKKSAKTTGHATSNMPMDKSKGGMKMDHSKHAMPMDKPKGGMKMDHSKHAMPMDKPKAGVKVDHSKMNHKPSIPVSDGSLDHDVPLPYKVAKMEDDPILTKIMIEQLEVHDADGSNPITWEAEAWIGKDLNKLWFKTEGERVDGENEELEVQALYSRAIAPYWDIQAGVRKDFKPEGREWGVVGLKGLAPYFFEADLALFAGDKGRTAARIQGEYELLLTQKTIISPEFELNLYGQNDREMGTGSGLSDATVGVRLRHEFKREFAPYIGVEWSKKFGNTADFVRDEGGEVSDTTLVTGIRAWF